MADNTAMLMEMGFDAERSQEALRVCDGNVERAIEYLFSGGTNINNDPPSGGGSSTPAVAAALPSNHQDMIVAPISQYSLDQGRSACTCIALTAAQLFLQQTTSASSGGTPTDILTPAWLEQCIREGVANYQTLQSSAQGGGGGGVEHMSAEDVLKMGAQNSNTAFTNLVLMPGGIRQGILTAASGSGMGLHDLLVACHRQQQAGPNRWMAVLITKTPETVVVLLPPQSQPSTFVVVDSHPRPGVVQGGGAYARILSSLNDLVTHLGTILPATELSPDIPEMMAIMYNSFDLYPLVLQQNK